MAHTYQRVKSELVQKAGALAQTNELQPHALEWLPLEGIFDEINWIKGLDFAN